MPFLSSLGAQSRKRNESSISLDINHCLFGATDHLQGYIGVDCFPVISESANFERTINIFPKRFWSLYQRTKSIFNLYLYLAFALVYVWMCHKRGVKHAEERKKEAMTWIFKMTIAHPSMLGIHLCVSQSCSCCSLLLDKLRVVIIL